MPRRLLVALCLVFLCMPVDTQSTEHTELIVHFKPGSVSVPRNYSGSVDGAAFLPLDMAQLLVEEGAIRIEPVFKDAVYPERIRNICILTLSRTYIDNSVLDALRTHPYISHIEPNNVETTFWETIPPGDPKLNEGVQWHLWHKGGPAPGQPGNDINALGAWEITTGSDEVIVAVIDCGILRTHAELSGRITGDIAYYPYDSHGTKMASVIGANTDNSLLIAGVNWHVTMNSQEIFSENGITYKCSAIEDALDDGARILNCSWSLGNETPEYSKTLHVGFIEAYKQNALTVAAMGNVDDYETRYPAGFGPGVCAVGASNHYEQRWGESSRGNHIDLMAPGTFIPACCYYSQDPQGYYPNGYGTSYSTAIVSGIASLLLSYDESLYNDDLENLIRISATRKGTETRWDDVIWDDSTGCGVANAYNALRLLQAPFSLFRDELLSGIQADVDLVLDNGQSYFDGIEGLAPGVYFFDIYRVRHNISYSEEYARTPYVWGRGVATTGYAFSAYPSTDVFYGLPMTEISNITETGFDVTSYVYRLYNISGVPVAFIPADTAHVTYAYSVLGIKDVSPPSVEVLTPNGGEYFKSGQKIGITWNVQDEYIEGIICGVSINYSGGIGDWTVLAHNLPVDSNGSGEFEFTIPCAIPHVEDDCRIRVIALDTNAKQGLDQSDLDFTIEYLLKPDDDPIPGQGSTPEFKDLVLDPIPNPFNPSTTLRFQVGKTGQVTIEIYDVAGKRIRTICKMRRFQPGSHDLLWDGKNKDGIDVANGIYFACFQINNMTDTKKLVLVR